MKPAVTSKEAVKLLKQAQKLISTPDKWIKGGVARNAEGKAVAVHVEEACKFCSIGALWRASKQCRIFTASDAEAYLDLAFDGNIPTNNDKYFTKHEHVMMAYDFAILMAKDEK